MGDSDQVLILAFMRTLMLALAVAALFAGCTNRYEDSPALAGLPPLDPGSQAGKATPTVQPVTTAPPQKRKPAVQPFQ